MRYAFFLFCVGCYQDEVYPHSDITTFCQHNESGCDDEIATRLNISSNEYWRDELIWGAKYVVNGGDPWLVDMLFYNIQGITSDCDPKNHDDSVAYYKKGKLRSTYGDVCLVNPEVLGMSQTSWAIMLLHEAGHGRPGNTNHKTCDELILDPQYIGTLSCDKDSFGALGVELIFWNNELGKNDSYLYNNAVENQIEDVSSRIYSFR
jgi:hypothetical protein